MKKAKASKFLIALMVVTLSMVGCGAKPAATPGTATTPTAPVETKHITIGTASVGGMNYPIGMALAKIWNTNVPGVKAVAIATNGAPHNIDLLRTNDIDAAVCRAVEANRAINGVAPYPEKMPWLRALTGGLFLDASQVLAMKDRGIKSVADFKGKKVAVGPVGSGGEVDAKETLAAYGLTYKDVQPQYIDATQAIDMMNDGLIDGAILGLTLGASAVSELMMSGKVDIIPVSDDAYKKMLVKNPYLQQRTIPKNAYPKQDYEVLTVGSPPDNIVTRVELPEAMAYQMTKSIYENKVELQGVAAVMKEFGEALVVEEDKMLLPYHPGSKKYFIEKGWIKK